MQEASFIGLLRILAIILIIYYILKIIARYVFPFFIKRTVSKMEDRFRQQQETQQPQGKVGETTVDRKPQNKKEISKDGGEYIDFEEME